MLLFLIIELAKDVGLIGCVQRRHMVFVSMANLAPLPVMTSGRELDQCFDYRLLEAAREVEANSILCIYLQGYL